MKEGKTGGGVGVTQERLLQMDFLFALDRGWFLEEIEIRLYGHFLGRSHEGKGDQEGGHGFSFVDEGGLFAFRLGSSGLFLLSFSFLMGFVGWGL